MSPFMFKVGTREKLISSRAAARLAAEISGEFGTVSGLILQLSRDGLAFAINQEAAYGLFSAQEMPGELVTVRYTTTDRYSRRRQMEATGVVVWSEVVGADVQASIRWG